MEVFWGIDSRRIFFLFFCWLLFAINQTGLSLFLACPFLTRFDCVLRLNRSISLRRVQYSWGFWLWQYVCAHTKWNRTECGGAPYLSTRLYVYSKFMPNTDLFDFMSICWRYDMIRECQHKPSLVGERSTTERTQRLWYTHTFCVYVNVPRSFIYCWYARRCRYSGNASIEKEYRVYK